MQSQGKAYLWVGFMENFIYLNNKIKGYSGKKLQKSYLNPGVVTYFEGVPPIITSSQVTN